MELSSFQRLVSFTVIVIVLVGLGVYLFLPSASGASGASGPPGPTSGHPGLTPPGGPAPSPSGSPGPSAPAGPGQAPDIYQWLPFTPSGLASAAQVTVRFGDDYGTYSYTESTASYLAPMRPLVTAQLAQLLGRAYATPGLASARVSGKQDSTASTAILSLRAFGPTSLTFVVAVTERISGSGGTSQQLSDYAVTLTGSGTAWQVSDIEAASVGNQ
jgi:hypothetical protein